MFLTCPVEVVLERAMALKPPAVQSCAWFWGGRFASPGSTEHPSERSEGRKKYTRSTCETRSYKVYSDGELHRFSRGGHRTTEAGHTGVNCLFGFRHIFIFEFLLGKRLRHGRMENTAENCSGVIEQRWWKRWFSRLSDPTQRGASLPRKRWFHR